jgi:hypothetical protein
MRPSRWLRRGLAAGIALLGTSPNAFAQSSTRTIPIVVIDHVFVPSLIAGQPATLLLDPVEGLMLDRAFARRHAIPAVGGEAAGLGGPVRAGGAGAAEHEVLFARGLAVSVGDRRLDVRLAPVIPLDSMMAPALGHHVDGLLGLDLLDGIVEVDFDRRVMRVHDRARFAMPAGAAVLPARLLAGKPIVETAIRTADGATRRAAMVLDFGMAGTMRLTTRFTDEHRMVDAIGSVVTSRAESGLGGALESVIGRLASLSLGTIELREPIVSLARERTGGDAAPPYDGLIGIGVMRRFRVFFDLAGARVVLVPTPRTSLPFVHAPSGATFAPLGGATRGLVVAVVAPNTPAASAGLQAGDRVLAVASRSAERWSKRDWQDAIDASDGRPLDVRVSRRGRSVEVQLAAPRLLASVSTSGTR